MVDLPLRHSSHSAACIYLRVRPLCWGTWAAKCESAARSSSPSAPSLAASILWNTTWGETDKYKVSWVPPASALSSWGHFNVIFFFVHSWKKTWQSQSSPWFWSKMSPPNITGHHVRSFIMFCIFHLINEDGVFFFNSGDKGGCGLRWQMEQKPFLVLYQRQPGFTFCLEQSDLVTMSPNDETGGQTRAEAKRGCRNTGR